jgi:transcriptional regulator with XRE-family HTH domain
MSPGQLIRKRRIAHGLTQAQLALRAGTTQAAVSRLENDALSPTVETLTGLLAVLGEVPLLGSERAESELDLDHLRASMARSPDERLALAISWNRLAGEIAIAGRAARAANAPIAQPGE